jgi:DNA-binding MarR family transcriptional regulator
MSRDLQFDPRDQSPDQEPQSRMPLSQGRGPGSGNDQQDPRMTEILETLRHLIDEATEGRPTVSEFLDRLEQRRVHPIASVQESGRWNGMVYEYTGVRVKGAKLGRAYTAMGLQQRKGVRYEPARDDERLARTCPASRHRESEIRSPQRIERLRDPLGITPTERATLWDIGRFRNVEVEDLRHARYAGHKSPLHRDLKHLAEVGYIQRRIVPVDGRGRAIEVVALTRRGRNGLRRISRETGQQSQEVYSDFVKPREIVHDAALYRMFLAEAGRIEKSGGRVQRVILDYEMKKRAYSPLAKAIDLPPLEYAERQREIAEENGLQVVDGHLVFPDLRIEYETPDGEERHIDLELATQNYRAAHIQSKAAAGFRVYADTRSGALAAVLDNHDIIAELLRM